ncbi:MAG: ABC transporter ATP-binding protein [Holophaga sp.]|nr:ABC transporter ATP-binding protein [Holophaga sp.]
MLLSLKLMFDVQFRMGGGSGVTLPKSAQRLFAFLPATNLIEQSPYLIPVIIAMLFILRGLLLYMGSLLVARAGMKAVRDLREKLFDRVLVQDPIYFQVHPVGELMNRVLGDVQVVQSLASGQVAEILKQISMAVVMLIFIFKTDWRLACFLMLIFPMVVLPVRYLAKAIRRQGHKAQGGVDMLLQRLKEVLSNMRVVKAFAREDYESERFRAQSHQIYRMGLRVVRIQSISSPIMESVGGILLAGLALYGSTRIRAGAITGTGFLVFLLAIYQLYDPIRVLTRIFGDMQMSSVSLERIFQILDSSPVIVSPEHPVSMPTKPQRLAFEGVRFTYGQHEVLQGLDLEVNCGETVALVGGSGGGKTTLVNLVPRFFDPTGGRITIDGVDIREYDPRDLRRHIGMVTQETLLFLDTVHDNIAYGQEATRDAVVQAAMKAHAHEFIVTLPKGYDTPLAETGSSLSGGQRQRIAIARALLQDPPILILDEATSALDTESERAVQAALEELMKDRTTLVIAHRLSTIQRATRICALKHGRIAEVGTHEQLLKYEGEYARLYNMQFQA